VEFTESLLSFFRTQELIVQPFNNAGETPFSVWQIADTNLLIHSIGLQAYAAFCEEARPQFFFQQRTINWVEAGYRTIHLWEDVWRQKPSLIASRLRALTGLSERIPARLTQLRRIDRPTTTQFLSENHLQVPTLSKYKFGLFLPSRYFRVLSPSVQASLPAGLPELLVAVATFSHPRTIPRQGRLCRSVELVRFANRLGCTVVGGLDKLLKGFVAEQQPDDIMTYADLDWSDGRSYEKLGFVRQGLTEPNPFWPHPDEGIRYYPHRLPEGLTEADLPQRGYLAVYNAGSVKFVKIYG